MESLIHADIFFFIASIVTVILGILLAIICGYAIKILADVREISSEIRDGIEEGSSMFTSFVRIIKRLT